MNCEELTNKEKIEITGGDGGNPFYDLGKWLGGLAGDNAVGLASSYFPHETSNLVLNYISHLRKKLLNFRCIWLK